MSNALHDYARLFERYAANNGGTGAILAGEDCLSLANEMRMDADAIDAENAKLRDLVKKLYGGYMVSCNGCENAYEDYGGYTPLEPDYCVFSFSDRYVGCWKRKRLEAEMRELGVGVDG